MTRIFWIEIDSDVKRRLDVLENDDVNVYINLKYLENKQVQDET